MTGLIERRRWAIAEGYIPGQSTGSRRAFVSHEAACTLNASDQDAGVAITIFCTDRGPVGSCRLTVPAQRTKHVRFNDLADPEPIPLDTDHASMIEASVPVVVQHTRLDSRQAERALLSTVAFASD